MYQYTVGVYEIFAVSFFILSRPHKCEENRNENLSVYSY